MTMKNNPSIEGETWLLQSPSISRAKAPPTKRNEKGDGDENTPLTRVRVSSSRREGRTRERLVVSVT